MTREEAIKHGKEQLDFFADEHLEFILRAIEALQVEPKTGEWILECLASYNQGWNDALNEYAGIIEEIPSAVYERNKDE